MLGKRRGVQRDELRLLMEVREEGGGGGKGEGVWPFLVRRFRKEINGGHRGGGCVSGGSVGVWVVGQLLVSPP